MPTVMRQRNTLTRAQTLLISLCPLVYYLFPYNPSYLLHPIKPICDHTLTYRAQTRLCIRPGAQSHTSPHGSSSLLVCPFIHCRASTRCTSDKPIWLSFPPAFIYMQLSGKTNNRPCTTDSISVSPSSSQYTPHELWIAVSVRRSDRNDKGQSLGSC